MARRPAQSRTHKPAPVSAGLLLYRWQAGDLQVFLAHPGGPFWKNKDAGAWTIPKGLINAGEEPLAAACREFQEETGIEPHGPFVDLGTVRQKAGKVIQAWAWQGDVDPATIRSNFCSIQFPPNSGKWISVPEVDRCEWYSLTQAREKMNPAQAELLDRLRASLSA